VETESQQSEITVTVIFLETIAHCRISYNTTALQDKESLIEAVRYRSSFYIVLGRRIRLWHPQMHAQMYLRFLSSS